MSRRSLWVALSVIAAAFLLVVVIISPLALRSIAVLPGIHWQELSNIGQTYGAVSALLAALALGGVAISVFLQVREARFNRVQTARTRQFELIQLAMSDATYMTTFSSPTGTAENRRQIAYINQYFLFLKMLWEFGDLPELELRYAAGDILGSTAGWSYWRDYRNAWLTLAKQKRRDREFASIVDEVHAKSRVRKHPDDVERPSPHSPKRQTSKARIAKYIGTVFAGVVAGAIGRRIMAAVRNWRAM